MSELWQSVDGHCYGRRRPPHEALHRSPARAPTGVRSRQSAGAGRSALRRAARPPLAPNSLFSPGGDPDPPPPPPPPPPTPPPPATPTPDPALLSQTHATPHASGPAFDARVSDLWAAILRDDPSLAMPFFFPLGAYAQVKDVADPAADWNRRLVAAYRRDIHALHARLAETGPAKLLGLSIPEERARWVEPGEEYNKIGYFRVFGSKLRFDVDGRESAVDVKSLISWRGEWFIVHLSAIK
jgi:hypothetical protein